MPGAGGGSRACSTAATAISSRRLLPLDVTIPTDVSLPLGEITSLILLLASAWAT